MNEAILNKPSKYSREHVLNLFQYTVGEDVANAVSHGLGVLFTVYAIANMAFIVGRYGNNVDIAAFGMYGFGMLLMFLMSTLYHSMINHTARDIFKRLDHAAIYVMIVGSYTPYVFSLVKTTQAYVIYTVLFVVMLVGVIYKVLVIKETAIISTAIYILMGLASVMLIPEMVQHMPMPGIILMVVSGALYIIGAILFEVASFKYMHALWHLFVIGGVVTMWVSINFFILQYR